MIAGEVFCELSDKYDDDFNRCMLPPSNHAFTVELEKEIGKSHFPHRKQTWVVTKCDSNDDVLYLVDNSGGTDIYYIFHLTYSECDTDGFSRYREFGRINAVKGYIKQSLNQDSSF